MKKLFWIVPVVLFLGACGLGRSDSENARGTVDSTKDYGAGARGKAIIVYYSLTENTKAMAEEIQKQTDSDVLRIETVEPYPEVYDDVLTIVQSQREADELPEIVKQEVDLSEYDSIFLGTPIWFGEPALPVEKWLSENELAGKTIYPFFTSGSSSIDESMGRYREVLTQATLGEGLGITSSDKSQTASLVEEWLAQ